MERIGRKIDRCRWRMRGLRRKGGDNAKMYLFRLYCEPWIKMGAGVVRRLPRYKKKAYIVFAKKKFKQFMGWPGGTQDKVLEAGAEYRGSDGEA